jgi:hypothetical protein
MHLRTIKSTGSIRKRAVEKLKTYTRLKKKNRAWNIPQIKTIKESHELGLLRWQTQHKVPEFLAPSVDKIANDRGI